MKTWILMFWAKQQLCPGAWLTSVLTIPLSKLVTRFTSKGIWFICSATLRDFERPLTCLSKLTLLAMSINIFLLALSCSFARLHSLVSGVVALYSRIILILISLLREVGLSHGADRDQVCNSSLMVLHYWCVFMLLWLVYGTRVVIPVRAVIIDSFPLKLPIF